MPHNNKSPGWKKLCTNLSEDWSLNYPNYKLPTQLKAWRLASGGQLFRLLKKKIDFKSLPDETKHTGGII